MMASRSETCESTGRSCVTKTTPDMIPCSTIASSISTSIRWLETSSAEVGSSAISSRGFCSVEITVIMRCFIPPESWCA